VADRRRMVDTHRHTDTQALQNTDTDTQTCRHRIRRRHTHRHTQTHTDIDTHSDTRTDDTEGRRAGRATRRAPFNLVTSYHWEETEQKLSKHQDVPTDVRDVYVLTVITSHDAENSRVFIKE